MVFHLILYLDFCGIFGFKLWASKPYFFLELLSIRDTVPLGTGSAVKLIFEFLLYLEIF